MNSVKQAAATLMNVCHRVAVSRGWWDTNGCERSIPELLMLCVSELAEAMEGDRCNLMDQHLPNRKSFEVELADTVIRIFDMAGGLSIDLPGAIAEKIEYNMTRADHDPEERMKENGKRY